MIVPVNPKLITLGPGVESRSSFCQPSPTSENEVWTRSMREVRRGLHPDAVGLVAFEQGRWCAELLAVERRVLDHQGADLQRRRVLHSLNLGAPLRVVVVIAEKAEHRALRRGDNYLPLNHYLVTHCPHPSLRSAPLIAYRAGACLRSTQAHPGKFSAAAVSGTTPARSGALGFDGSSVEAPVIAGAYPLAGQRRDGRQQ